MNDNTAIKSIAICLLLLNATGCTTLFRQREFAHVEVKDVTTNVTHESYEDFEVYRFSGLLLRQLYDVKSTDRDLWIGTKGGLHRFAIKEKRWFHYGRSAGLEGDLIKSIAICGKTLALDVWTEPEPNYTKDLGTYLFDPRTLEWKRLMGNVGWFLESGISSLIYSPRRHPGGIEIRNYVTDSTQWYTSKNSALVDDNVMGASLREGCLWAASRGNYDSELKDFVGGGVTCLNPVTRGGLSFTTNDGLSRGYCSAICTDGRKVWVAHWYDKYGLSVYDIKTRRWSVITESANGVNNIGGVHLLMKGQELFVGQQGGLVILDTMTMRAKRYTVRDGLPGYIVSGISSNRDSVWVALYSRNKSAGIAVFNR